MFYCPATTGETNMAAQIIGSHFELHLALFVSLFVCLFVCLSVGDTRRWVLGSEFWDLGPGNRWNATAAPIPIASATTIATATAADNRWNVDYQLAQLSPSHRNRHRKSRPISARGPQHLVLISANELHKPQRYSSFTSRRCILQEPRMGMDRKRALKK